MNQGCSRFVCFANPFWKSVIKPWNILLYHCCVIGFNFSALELWLWNRWRRLCWKSTGNKLREPKSKLPNLPSPKSFPRYLCSVLRSSFYMYIYVDILMRYFSLLCNLLYHLKQTWVPAILPCADRLQKSKFPIHCWRNKVVKCMLQSLLNFRWVCCNWLHTPNTERLFFQIELDFLKWYHVWLMSVWKIGPACLKSCTANLWNIRQVSLNFAVIG